MTTTAGEWQPGQYARFQEQRSQPFYDLAALVQRAPRDDGATTQAGPRVVDLGSGTGQLTAWLHGELGAAETLGVDSSEAMLAESAAHAGGGVRFEQADISAFARACAGDGTSFDVVFSNAALQWIDDHAALFPLVAGLVAPGGQLAVQMPTNDDHASHEVARALARSEPFATALGGYVRPDPVRTPEWYAEQLHALGFAEQRVQLVVYPHVLPDGGAVVEWVKGSLLTAYRRRLDPPTYEAFLAAYADRLRAVLGDQAPYFYAFKRLLLWGRRSSRPTRSAASTVASTVGSNM
jgi:trans-aconitate 2-methyltransferase